MMSTRDFNQQRMARVELDRLCTEIARLRTELDRLQGEKARIMAEMKRVSGPIEAECARLQDAHLVAHQNYLRAVVNTANSMAEVLRTEIVEDLNVPMGKTTRVHKDALARLDAADSAEMAAHDAWRQIVYELAANTARHDTTVGRMSQEFVAVEAQIAAVEAQIVAVGAQIAAVGAPPAAV